MAVPNNPLDLLVEQLSHESSPLRRRQVLLSAKDAWTTETVSRFYEEAVRLRHVDIPQAERMARAAVWLSKRLGDEPSQAAGLRAMGHVLERKRRYKQAIEQFEQSLAIYERLGDEVEVARTLNSQLQCLMYLGRYSEALEYADRAQKIFSRHGDLLRLARLEANIGNILHRQDRFDDALELYRQAHASLARCGEASDVAIVLQNMATCQIGMNEFRDALETYQQARTYSINHDLPLLVAVADYNIAYLYYLRGEYTHAIELYRAAREHCHSLGDAYREALCDLDQSEMYLELNLSEEGAHLARRALASFQRLGNGYEAAKALTNLAISLSHHGDAQLTLSLFKRARDLFLREGNKAWMASIDLYQALVFYQEKRLAEARQLCEKAFQFFAPTSFVGKAALCELLLSRIHLDSGRTGKARELCAAALERLTQAESPALSYQAYFVLGLIEEADGSREKAQQAYEEAHRHLENLRSHLKSEDTKVAFLKDKLDVYESLVRLSLSSDEPGNKEVAFAYIEQAKSRSLADLIAFRAQSLPASTEAHRSLVENVRSLREELNWYTRAIQLQEGRSGNLRDPRLEKLRRSARECEHRLVESMANVRVEDREFANVQGGASIDLDAIRGVLPADAILLQYYRVRDNFHACLVSRKGLRIVPLGSVSELRRALQLLRFQLSKFRLGGEYIQTFQQQLLEATNSHLQEFHRQLIAPIAKDLKAEHLIVAPHDFLHYLPFHALLDAEGETLGHRYSISYTPSASVYYLCATKVAHPADRALVLGVPDPSVPYIIDEVAAVASVLPNAEVFIGGHATYDVLREKGAHARYVHIATHGSFRQDNPMFSSISLGDMQLSLFDLYQLNLSAELVTLSGCGTGLNVVVGGDELMGLKRGLLYAGAQGLLLTLWDVNDQSTAAFMKLFYERLKTDPDKGRAVQYAADEIRREYPHPFYWAPFVLVGQYQPPK